MAEPVLDTSIADGQQGALSNWDTLNLFHNNWIHGSGDRTFLPEDFLRGSGWAVFVDDYADADEDVDATSAILEAASNTSANGGLLVYGARRYECAASLEFPNKPILHMGAWGHAQLYSSGDYIRCATRIIFSYNGDCFVLGVDDDKLQAQGIPGQFGGIMNMGILCTGGGTLQVGLVVDTRGVLIQNVEVAGAGLDGIHLRDCVGGKLDFVHSARNARHGILIDPSLGSGGGPPATTATDLHDCTVIGNGDCGLRIHPGAWGITSSGFLITEGNASWGIFFSGTGVAAGTRFSELTGVWEELNRRIDTVSISTGVSTVLNTNAHIEDTGKTVFGTGIPQGAQVYSVTPGVSFEVIPVPTATGSISLTVGAPIRFNDNNTSDNHAKALRWGSGWPSDGGNRNRASGVIIADVWPNGDALRQYEQIGDIVTAGGYTSADTDCLRVINENQTEDGVIRARRFISTLRAPTTGPGVLTSDMDVPDTYDYNLGNNGSIGAMRFDPGDGDYEVISSGSDDAVIINGDDFAGAVTRIYGKIDLEPAKGMTYPKVTTAERNAMPDLTTGDTCYNVDNDIVQTWNGSVWKDHYA